MTCTPERLKSAKTLTGLVLKQNVVNHDKGFTGLACFVKTIHT